MTHRLVLENLKHRPIRSLLSTLLIGVPVTLILCLIGLSTGLLEDSQRRARGVVARVVDARVGHVTVVVVVLPHADRVEHRRRERVVEHQR